MAGTALRLIALAAAFALASAANKCTCDHVQKSCTLKDLTGYPNSSPFGSGTPRYSDCESNTDSAGALTADIVMDQWKLGSEASSIDFTGLKILTGSIILTGLRAPGVSKPILFPDLEEVQGNLEIGYSDIVTSISAPKLKTVTGNLNIQSNSEIVNLTFPSLTSVGSGLTGGWLRVTGNKRLEFVALPTLTNASVGGLSIYSDWGMEIRLPVCAENENDVLKYLIRGSPSSSHTVWRSVDKVVATNGTVCPSPPPSPSPPPPPFPPPPPVTALHFSLTFSITAMENDATLKEGLAKALLGSKKYSQMSQEAKDAAVTLKDTTKYQAHVSVTVAKPAKDVSLAGIQKEMGSALSVQTKDIEVTVKDAAARRLLLQDSGSTEILIAINQYGYFGADKTINEKLFTAGAKGNLGPALAQVSEKLSLPMEQAARPMVYIRVNAILNSPDANTTMSVNEILKDKTAALAALKTGFPEEKYGISDITRMVTPDAAATLSPPPPYEDPKYFAPSKTPASSGAASVAATALALVLAFAQLLA